MISFDSTLTSIYTQDTRITYRLDKGDFHVILGLIPPLLSVSKGFVEFAIFALKWVKILHYICMICFFLFRASSIVISDSEGHRRFQNILEYFQLIYMYSCWHFEVVHLLCCNLPMPMKEPISYVRIIMGAWRHIICIWPRYFLPLKT